MTHPSHAPLSQSAVEVVAGLLAGFVSTIVVHPLDVIKTRLQIDPNPNPTRFGSSLHVLRTILAESRSAPSSSSTSSAIRSFYRGLTPNVIGNSLGWSLYFLWYHQIQTALSRYHGYPNSSLPHSAGHSRLSSLDYLAASGLAGVLSAILTNPIWVIKTRMLSTSAAQHGAYPSMISGLRSIYHDEGWRGYFRGLVPTLAGVTHGALYFVAYEKLKAERRQLKSDATLTNTDTLLLSGLSKVFAGGLTYPHQLVRARMQTYATMTTSPTLGVVGVVKQIWQREGFLGFYKGLGPNLLRVLPSTCVTFLVYENVKWGLPRAWGGVEQPNREKESVI